MIPPLLGFFAKQLVLSAALQKGYILSFSTLIFPYFVTGWGTPCDAEGSFQIRIREDIRYKTGWFIQLRFALTLHKKDRFLLEAIQKSWGGIGSIDRQGENAIQYRISAIKDLEIVINHFDNFPLITQKWADHELFKQAFDLIKNKKHLSKDGLDKIVSIRASVNNGLSKMPFLML